MTSQTTTRAIVLTVGTGNVEAARETLLEPLTKSITQGDWAKVVLLPSHVTAETAAQLREELQLLPIEVRPLPAAGLEDNLDQCFAHFDEVIAELRAAGFTEILADFTRGTKSMSAALVLAAVRHDLARLRYISGPRDARGMVLPGHESISDIPVAMVMARKILDQVRHFFCRGNFAAAIEVLPAGQNPGWPDELFHVAQRISRLAEFYAAWDRLDYRAADQGMLPELSELPADWAAFCPSEETREWVRELARLCPEDHAERARYLRRLVVDLCANGRRRVRQQHYEDAILRAYRVLELVGQIRLFDRGLDSAALPPDHPDIQRFQEKLRKNKSAELSVNRDGKLMASREQVARLLKAMGDPLAKVLLEMGGAGAVRPAARNLSVLIHGFQASPVDTPQPLEELYQKLRELLVKDSGTDADAQFRIAESIQFAG